MQLTLIRHGETIWNREKRVQGLTDIELSETGIDQAEAGFCRLQMRLSARFTPALKKSPSDRRNVNGFHGRKVKSTTS